MYIGEMLFGFLYFWLAERKNPVHFEKVRTYSKFAITAIFDVIASIMTVYAMIALSGSVS